ncbi:MAG: hypothetical protein BVN35_05580 [Proteobacteria bacterium ST_bin11]|nr:MAG: hypothetical protein BVN35_05580 [Proteobacteria bacterium ST_bin11]
MKQLLFAFGITVVAAVAAIVAGSMSWLFWDAWKSTDLEAFRALLGAFSGAFFAYVFVRFGDALKKIYECKEAHYFALLRLQHYFNDCLNTTSDNVFIINDCCHKVFSEIRLASADAPIYMNSFQQYQINRQIVMSLTNIDFLNEVYSLNVSLQKINDSLATIDRAYSQLRDAFLAKNIDLSTYKTNARQYRDRCAEMRGFLDQLKEDLIRLLAITNLLLEDRPFLVRVTQSSVRTSYPKNLDALLKIEWQKVITEIDASGKASAQKINQAQRTRSSD